MLALPTGTVTLLFTDIEGSTRLLQQLGAGYQPVIADHHRLLRAAIEDAGVVVEDRGDGLFGVFARAVDALTAAANAQRTLSTHLWPAGCTVRVRMGIHTGEPALVGSNYVGIDVHRAARLCDAGHGGQILMSTVTRELVEPHLPDGVTVRDLGEHRLRDLQRPEQILQAVVAGLPDEFLPLRSVGRRPNNLPVARDPIIGRDADVEAARALLLRDDVGLVTLTGPGGSGKTRLGLQVATSLLDRFEDGVFLVMLAPVSDPSLVPGTIARALGFRESSEVPVFEGLEEHLREKEVLLLLDNFEQLLPAAPLIAELLSACPRLKALVTSRAALRLRGERELPVPPLALPELGTQLSVERLQQYTAIALFAERAREVRPDFAITTENAPAVAEICQRLDGLPLAIELAAARTRLLSPQAMLGRLGRALPFLTGGSRDLPSRQQTLRDTIDWSYDLLSEDEQRLFRRLGVFVGGCTLEAADAVGDGEMRDERQGATSGDLVSPLDLVASLVDKSLLRQQDGPGGEPRFTMLETIREYALEQLEASGEADAIRLRHAEYCTRLAEEAAPALRASTDSLWFDRLEAEHGNLRSALAWCDATDGARHLLPRIAAGIWMFWWRGGHWSEGRRWLERATELAVEPATRLQILNGRVQMATGNGEYTLVLALCEEVEELARTTGNLATLAFAKNRQSFIFSMLGDAERGERLAREAQALALQSGNQGVMSGAFDSLGRALYSGGDRDGARRVYEEGLRHVRENGIAYMVPNMLINLAGVASSQNDLAGAAILAEEALDLARQRNDRWSMQQGFGQLARIAQLLGDRDRVAAFAHESLLLLRTIGQRPPIVDGLLSLAWVARADGLSTRTARLVGAAEAIRETIGLPSRAVRLREWDDQIARLRDQLDETALLAGLNEGRAFSLDRAFKYALEEIDLD